MEVDFFLKQYDAGKRDFTLINLENVDLTEANLSDINLSGANLNKAILIEADLTQANLINTNLKEANLEGVNLAKAKLDKADLTGANLNNGNLIGVDLTEVILDNVSLHNTIMPNGLLYEEWILNQNSDSQFNSQFDSQFNSQNEVNNHVNLDKKNQDMDSELNQKMDYNFSINSRIDTLDYSENENNSIDLEVDEFNEMDEIDLEINHEDNITNTEENLNTSENWTIRNFYENLPQTQLLILAIGYFCFGMLLSVSNASIWGWLLTLTGSLFWLIYESFTWFVPVTAAIAVFFSLSLHPAIEIIALVTTSVFLISSILLGFGLQKSVQDTIFIGVANITFLLILFNGLFNYDRAVLFGLLPLPFAWIIALIFVGIGAMSWMSMSDTGFTNKHTIQTYLVVTGIGLLFGWLTESLF